MNKFVSALAVLTVGGTVLASGVATAAAAPAGSNAHKPHNVARSTAAAHGKASTLKSTTAGKAQAKAATPKLDANASVVLKQYNFLSYRALDADTDTLGANGTRVQLWDDAGSDAANQTWVYTGTDTAGLYKINNLASGRALDADSDTLGGNGTTVQLWDDLGNGQANQLWWLIDTGYYDVDSGNELYKWQNYASGRVLDADSDTVADNGTTVQLWDDLGVDAFNQDWEF
jgi:hypothetical protein